MPGWTDFLFGKGALNKAAGPPSPPQPAAPYQPAGIDIAALAQHQADMQRPVVGAPLPKAPPPTIKRVETKK